jgi:hypothetical protein
MTSSDNPASANLSNNHSYQFILAYDQVSDITANVYIAPLCNTHFAYYTLSSVNWSRPSGNTEFSAWRTYASPKVHYLAHGYSLII